MPPEKDVLGQRTYSGAPMRAAMTSPMDAGIRSPQLALSAQLAGQDAALGARYTQAAQPLSVAHSSAHASGEAAGTPQPSEGTSMSGEDSVAPMWGVNTAAAEVGAMREAMMAGVAAGVY